jgi:hypothetical protein
MKRTLKILSSMLILCPGLMLGGEGGLLKIDSAGYIPRNAVGGFASEPVTCKPVFIQALQRYCDDTPQCEFMASLAFCRTSFAPMEALLSVDFTCRYESGVTEAFVNQRLEADELVTIDCG